MKTQHTPGPWHFGKSSREIWGGGKNIARIAPGVLCGFHAPGADEQDANARLIASAPGLLAALQAIHAGFVDGSIKWAKPRQADSDPYHPANTLMTAALARATGEGQS